MSATPPELLAEVAAFQPLTLRDHVAVRTAQPDYGDWLEHISSAAACTRPIRLAGDLYTVRGTSGGGGEVFRHTPTDRLPDGVIYKACGNRRASICPACARIYQRDAYQVLRTMLVGGKGVPAAVARHPAAFVTLTAPSFGTVHTRVVRKHTCTNRGRCDCRAEPCHARSNTPGRCRHGQPAVCWARHETGDTVIGRPLCLDCYDHDHQVVWNLFSGELWRRTSIALSRHLARRCRERRIPFRLVELPGGKVRSVAPVRIVYGKVAEYQRRGVVHFHILIRLDGYDPDDPDTVLPPPAGLSFLDLHDAVAQAATDTVFGTPVHPDRPDGWPVTWGDPDKGLDIREISLTGRDDVTDGLAAGYLAKYATKSTEVTGHRSTRLTADTVDLYADPEGDHIARLIDACWRLGRATRTPQRLSTRPRPTRPAVSWTPRDCPDCGTRTRLAVCPTCTPDCQPEVDTESIGGTEPNPYARLRRAAHMLGFGGHFLTKARRHRVTFGLLRANRVTWRRTNDTTTPDQPIRTADHLDEETTLVVGVLTFAGAGWHTIGDAALANTAAAMARARADAAREELAHEIGTAVLSGGTLVAA
ncbi:replication initiator [Dactylosporangium sp. McL0621]|uniref:replication initiator n=1 Tax=Dactylosporangium sp. McL0621 TaxID=3415678 RepID=UPI003CF4E4A7